MCECCEDIDFLKEIYDERFEFKAVIMTKSKGGTATHGTYLLNYCPNCGKRINEVKCKGKIMKKQ